MVSSRICSIRMDWEMCIVEEFVLIRYYSKIVDEVQFIILTIFVATMARFLLDAAALVLQ